jgi:integrase
MTPPNTTSANISGQSWTSHHAPGAAGPMGGRGAGSLAHMVMNERDETNEHETAPLLLTASPSALAPLSPRHRCVVPQCPAPVQLPDDGILLAWLDEKTGRSRSWKTHVAYHTTALSLRDALRAQGFDLFCDLSEETRYASFLPIVQQWAGTRAEASHHSGPISAATYNQRLATISSLYSYARRMRLYRGDNPIEAIARRTLGEQHGAQALDVLEMRKRLVRINRATLAGQRDYALLSVALQTGSRVQALADMRIGDLTWAGERLVIHFPRTKGGETDDKELEVETSKAVAAYLRAQYGECWQDYPQAPVWVSTARNASRGKQLSAQALEQICLKHVGTSKFHTLRHTAGLTLEELGATTSEIQSFLRHKNIATTSRYLKRARRAKNKYGRDLEQVFGIRGQAQQDDG